MVPNPTVMSLFDGRVCGLSLIPADSEFGPVDVGVKMTQPQMSKSPGGRDQRSNIGRHGCDEIDADSVGGGEILALVASGRRRSVDDALGRDKDQVVSAKLGRLPALALTALGPAGPAGPCCPGAPMMPCIPCGPVGPSGPTGPVGPVGPGGP